MPRIILNSNQRVLRLSLNIKGIEACIYIPTLTNNLTSYLCKGEGFVTKSLPFSDISSGAKALSALDATNARNLLNNRRLVICAHASLISQFDTEKKEFSFFKKVSFHSQPSSEIRFVGDANYVLSPRHSKYIYFAPFDCFRKDVYKDGSIPNHNLSGDYIAEKYDKPIYYRVPEYDWEEHFLNEAYCERLNQGISKKERVPGNFSNSDEFNLGATTGALVSILKAVYQSDAQDSDLLTQILPSYSSGSGRLNDLGGTPVNILHIESGRTQLSDLYDALVKLNIRPSQVLVWCCRGYGKSPEHKPLSDWDLRDRRLDDPGYLEKVRAEYDARLQVYSSVLSYYREECKTIDVTSDLELSQLSPLALHMINYYEAAYNKAIVENNYQSAVDLCESLLSKFKVKDNRLVKFYFCYYLDCFFDLGMLSTDDPKLSDMVNNAINLHSYFIRTISKPKVNKILPDWCLKATYAYLYKFWSSEDLDPNWEKWFEFTDTEQRRFKRIFWVEDSNPLDLGGIF